MHPVSETSPAITPDDIDTRQPGLERNFHGAFEGNFELERGAFVIVQMYKEAGPGKSFRVPFTREQFVSFCSSGEGVMEHDVRALVALAEAGYLITGDHITYTLTEEFVEACWETAPA